MRFFQWQIRLEWCERQRKDLAPLRHNNKDLSRFGGVPFLPASRLRETTSDGLEQRPNLALRRPNDRAPDGHSMRPWDIKPRYPVILIAIPMPVAELPDIDQARGGRIAPQWVKVVQQSPRGVRHGPLSLAIPGPASPQDSKSHLRVLAMSRNPVSTWQATFQRRTAMLATQQRFARSRFAVTSSLAKGGGVE